MGRKLAGWQISYLAMTILVSLVVSYFFYKKWQIAESNLAEYKLAISCPSTDNCREKFEATILEGHARRVFIAGVKSKYGSGPSFRDMTYIFTVSSQLGKQTVVVSANPPSVGIPFDIGNVQVPPATGDQFLKENFYTGEEVFIETWQGQIVFLYTDPIVDFSDIAINQDLDSGSSKIPTTLQALPQTTHEVALPTTLHPLLLHASAQYNFAWVAFFGVLSIFTYVVFIFNGRKNS